MSSAEKTKGRELPYRQIFAFIHGHLKRTPLVYACIIASAFIMAFVEVMIPIVGEHLIRAANIGVSEKADVYRLFWLFAGSYTAYWGVRYAFHFLYSHMLVQRMRDIVLESFKRIQSFSAQWHLDSFAGATVRDITRGMNAFESFLDMVCMTMLPGILILLGTGGYLLTKWPMVGACFIAFCVVFLSTIGTIAIKFVAPRNRAMNAADSEAVGAIADAITCNIVVRSFGSEDTEYEKLQTITASWAKKTLSAWWASLANGALQTIMLLTGRFSLVGWVVLQWSQGVLDAASVAFAIMIAGLLNAYLRDFGYQLRMMQKSLNELEAVVVFSKTKPAIADKPNAKPLVNVQGRLAFEQVGFAYTATKPVFQNLNVSIEQGQMVALVGASGSGKSTFIKLIQRFYDVQEGAVTIDGIDVRDVTQQSLRRAIATVPQEPILFHRSLFDNIAYARPEATRDEVIHAAKLANAAQFIETLPNGYETEVGERGVKLSGGERQRIAIARAILANAPLLILDEATSSLDSVSERLIQRSMADLTRGRTTIVVAHRLSTIRAANRILVFKNGTIAEDGTHEALLSQQNGLYRHLYETQYALENN